MSVKSAFDQLAQLNVSGVTTHFGLDDIPGTIPAPDLPALVVVPARLGTGGLEMSAFEDGTADLVLHVDHALLVCGLGEFRVQERFYQALELVDNYLSALKEDIVLDGELIRPVRIVGVQIGAYEFGGQYYYAVVFKHRWEMDVP